mmetsp:Transcript_22/g.50  ORF Transcript_22/g.50 Transcript_22/m.50 type:complete len:515 (-) Transcript_22:169-1713(-)
MAQEMKHVPVHVRAPRFTSPMSFLPRIVFVAAVLSLAPTKVITDSCCAEDADEEDYFPLKVQSEYSQDWEVTYGPNYKLVTVSTGSPSIFGGQQTLVLYQCGTTQPDVASLPTAFQTPETKWIQIPVQRVALGDTTSVTYFERVGARDTLVSVNQFTTSACVAREVDNGITRYANSTEVNSATYYQVTLNNPDLAIFDSYTLLNNPDLAALPYSVVFVGSSDPGLVQRAEWVEFFSLFLNQERVGLRIASLVHERIFLSGAQSQETSRLQLANQRRVTAWMSYFGGFWTVSSAAYLFDPSDGAFGYAACDNGAGRFSVRALSGLDNDDLYNTMCTLDLVFFSIYDVGFYIDFVDDWTDWVKDQGSGYECIPISDLRVYSNDKTLGPDGVSTDFFESALADGDQFVADVVWAVYEDVLGAVPGSLERRYIRNFFTETRYIQTAKDCDDADFEASQYRENGCYSDGLPWDIEFDDEPKICIERRSSSSSGGRTMVSPSPLWVGLLTWCLLVAHFAV